MSEALFASFEGPNGARVEVRDLSKPYAYSNIYHVRLEVTARFPAGGEVFERTLEKMGVFEGELAETKKGLLESFRETGLPYLFRGDFAQRLAEAKAREEPKAAGYGKG